MKICSDNKSFDGPCIPLNPINPIKRLIFLPPNKVWADDKFQIGEFRIINDNTIEITSYGNKSILICDFNFGSFRQILIGYKGKGMCRYCAFSFPNIDNHLICSTYASLCKKVARNCTGIKILK